MGAYLWNWMMAAFKDYNILLIYMERADGSVTQMDGAIMWDSGEIIPVVEIKPDLAFERDTRLYTRAEYELLDATGKRRRLSLTRLSRGIYFGGGISGQGFWEYKGSLNVEGEQWDLNDQKMLVSLGSMFKDTHSRFECDGDTGYGMIENVVSRKHVKYGPSL